MAGGGSIRLMVVEDHALFGHGLRRVLELEEDIQVVAEVNDGAVAVERALEVDPDVILMDINLPGMNGLQATRQILDNQRDVGVIILTAYHDDEQLFHALRAGAAAYFSKDVQPAELIPAIRAAAQGNYVIDEIVMNRPQVTAWIRKQFEDADEFYDSVEDRFVPLSRREMEILAMITRGASNKEIAKDLGISRQTVKNHMSSILRKLAVNDRTQAAVVALKRGWVRMYAQTDQDSSVQG